MIGLARYHLPLCATLRDPAIDSAAQASPESGRELYRKVVAGRLLEERSLVLDQLSRSGVLTVDAVADRLTPTTINRYMELKERALL
jgi:uncharacterized protein (DUF58 family)